MAFTRLGMSGFPRGLYGDFTGKAVEVSAALSGTVADDVTEGEIVAGGETLIITLTGGTWAAAGTGPVGSTADTQAIIDGMTGDGAEATGWNAEVRDKEVTTAVVRTSDTVVTITLSAAASYDITADETITVTVPAQAISGASPVVATPAFDATFIPLVWTPITPDTGVWTGVTPDSGIWTAVTPDTATWTEQ